LPATMTVNKIRFFERKRPYRGGQCGRGAKGMAT
jgi:hypothetical protein